MSEIEIKELEDKIIQGVALANERLLEQKKKEDGELILADKDGKVIRVKARDIQ